MIDWWIGDHAPKHVHIYREGQQVAKVEVPSLLVLSGKVDGRLRKILVQLLREQII